GRLPEVQPNAVARAYSGVDERVRELIALPLELTIGHPLVVDANRRRFRSAIRAFREQVLKEKAHLCTSSTRLGPDTQVRPCVSRYAAQSFTGTLSSRVARTLAISGRRRT